MESNNIPRKDEFQTSTAPYISQAFSDRILLSISLIGFAFIAITIYSIILLRLKSNAEIEKDDLLNGDNSYDDKLTKADISTLNRAQRRARAHAIMKQKRRATMDQPIPNNNRLLDNEENEEGNDQRHDDDNEIDDVSLLEHTDVGENHRLSRKERQHVAKLIEKKERQFVDEDRRRQQLQAQEEARREKQERLKQRSMQQEEERLQQRQRKIEQEKEANDEWLTFVSTPNVRISVEEWMNQLSKNRIYDVFDAVATYGDANLSPSDVFARIETLVNEGRVAGILEKDQGKFIYMNDEELFTISRAIMSLGSVSLHDVIDIISEQIIIK